MGYTHKTIEKKWQKYWADNRTFKTTEAGGKPKYYVLDMFPYPSGQGLHVGHPEGYTATDIVARAKRAQGFNVLHPMGWDAFGLPAEQYALDTGNDPADFTELNIKTFKRQIQSLGFSYDWSREINTTDPSYYKWTQWIFTKLYEQGLAYEAEVSVNWCPALGTVLANEEVVDGVSERGGHPVYRKPMRQWMLKITAYAERLLDDLELVDWPESIKEMQRNWIGRSEGSNVIFKIKDSDKEFTVFTTRPDTLYGATYAVMAPELPLVKEIMSNQQAEVVKAYIDSISLKSDLDRTELAKEKTGVFTGAYAINPVNGKEIPIWIADYVLATYGTGAIMAVPAHDTRDYEFAKKFDLEIIPVLEGGNVEEEAYTEDGLHINSDFLNGLDKATAIAKMNDWLSENGLGEKVISYRLRDWLFSRQRYWGEPIPVIHWEDGTSTTVPENELPLLLPKTDQVKPSGTGESPLAVIDEWVNVVDPVTGMKGRRETNTMPQWAGSSWYFLRFMDPHNRNDIASKERLDYWQTVDLYIGGAEHAVLHLLYARFWHKFLYDIGIVPTKEPFQKLYNQGMILGENNEKMSKSKGNVVNPDDIVERYGADTLRMYEMFMGPLDASSTWSEGGIEGSRKFLDRIWRLLLDENDKMRDRITTINTHELDKVYHQTVKKVTEDYDNLHFNTAISQMMIFINEAYKVDALPFEYVSGFIQLLAPIAPHFSEELWVKLGKPEGISYVAWPTYDESFLVEAEISGIPDQRQSKTKEMVPSDISNDDMIAMALENSIIKEGIEGNGKETIAIRQIGQYCSN